MNISDLMINIVILTIGRSLDLLSTWYGTPNFEIELNTWMKKVGWRNTILINIVLVLVASRSRKSAIILGTLSMIIAARNFQVGTMARAIGEQNYRATYRKFVSSTPWYFNMLPIFCESAIYMTIGIAICELVGRNPQGNLEYVGDIGLCMFSVGAILLGATIGQRLEQKLNLK
jgi:hypothetical protein